jgi:hypothetical protein
MGTARYCQNCAADVYDVGGMCARGHRLPPSSIGELRAEIDRTFEHAMAEVAALLAEPTRPPAPPRMAPPPPPPPSVITSPPAPAQSPPGQVPPPPAHKTSVWSQLETETRVDADGSDPIAAFAPSPRMDWGPERASLLDVRNLWRRPSGVSV